MTEVTQKICIILFPLWSLKKQSWGVLMFKNRIYKKSSKIEVDIGSNTDILSLLLILIIIMIILLYKKYSSDRD